MTVYQYSGDDWREALSKADDAHFCDIEARETGGELAGVVTELRNDETPESDESLVFAAINAAEQLRLEFDRKFLAQVIKAYDNVTTGRLEERAIGFIRARWPNFPIQYTRNLSAFAIEYALLPGERAADDGSGSFCVFDVSELLPTVE
ncbi:hypothetical protein [Streptomyces sp. NPDC003032]